MSYEAYDTSSQDLHGRKDAYSSAHEVEYVKEPDQDLSLQQEFTIQSYDGFGDTFKSVAEDGEFKWTFSSFAALAGISLGWAADILMLSGAASILSIINEDIGPSPSYTWILSVCTVAGACLSPLIGRFGDIFGRRNFMLLGSAAGTIGNIICGTGNNVNTLIGGGVIIGIGTACHQNGWTCVGELVPKKSRGVALGCLEASFAPASIFAGLIAYGFVNDGGYWRGVFWVSMATNVIAFLLVFFFYHPKNQFIHEEGRTVWDQVRDMDWVGVFLVTAGVVLFLLGISFGGAKYPWVSAGTLAPLFIGFFTLVGLGFWEAYATLKYPLLPPALFKDVRGFTVFSAVVLVAGMLYYATLIIFPLQVSIFYARGNNIKIGAYSIATAAGGIIIAPLTGWVLKKYKKIHILLPVSVALLTLFGGLQAIVGPHTNAASTVLVFIAIGIVGGIACITSAGMQTVVPHEYIGVSTGICVGMRNLGGALGATVYSSVLQQSLKKNIVNDVATPLAEAGVPLASLPVVLEALTTGDETNPILATLTLKQLEIAAEGLSNSYVGAFKLVYLVSIAFGGLALVLSLFVRNIDKEMTNVIDIELQQGLALTTKNDEDGGHVVHFANAQAARDHAHGIDTHVSAHHKSEHGRYDAQAPAAHGQNVEMKTIG